MTLEHLIEHWWKNHGTKILGAIVTGAGIFGEVASLVQAYLDSLDPKHAALYALITGLGVAVIKRGFTNSKQ